MHSCKNIYKIISKLKKVNRINNDANGKEAEVIARNFRFLRSAKPRFTV